MWRRGHAYVHVHVHVHVHDLIDGGAVAEGFELLANCVHIFEGNCSVKKDKVALACGRFDYALPPAVRRGHAPSHL